MGDRQIENFTHGLRRTYMNDVHRFKIAGGDPFLVGPVFLTDFECRALAPTLDREPGPYETSDSVPT